MQEISIKVQPSTDIKRQTWSGWSSAGYLQTSVYVWSVKVVALSDVLPWVHVVLEGLQSGLYQIQRLEEQSGASATERATHKGLQGRMSLTEQTQRIMFKKTWTEGKVRKEVEKNKNR